MKPFNKRHRLLFVWTLRSGIVILVIVAWALLRPRHTEEAVAPGQQVEGLTSILTREAVEDKVPIQFADVTADSGIRFRHFPATRSSLLPEDMGSGVAVGDYDNDGLPDVFMVNFAGPITDPLPTDDQAARCRLFRNLGDMRFEDVTDSSGVGLVAFAMGAAWGDYDSDGDLDLYVTTFSDNALFENQGNGVFKDVTATRRVNDERFSTGCGWADYDRDGDLDLYVSNYVDFTFRAADRGAASQQYGTEQPYTLNPSAYQPQGNSLFRNKGGEQGAVFEEVAVPLGVADPTGRSLTVSWLDMNNDTLPDLYIANDVSNNGVYLNRGNGVFEDVGPSSLAADYRGAMGIAAADFDQDLDLDLLITHWIAQENALFRNMLLDPMFDPTAKTEFRFLDSADVIGLGQISLDAVGWATGFVDLDNDGRLDLWVVNGSTFEQRENKRLLIPQRPFLFWSRGPEDYIDVADKACPRFLEPFVGRGGVHTDFDGDGRVDLLFNVHGSAPILLRNVTETAGHWLAVRLRQPTGNRFAIGARVYLTTDETTRMAEVGVNASYLSQDDTEIHFGLGDGAVVDVLRVVWPDGSETVQHDVAADRHVVINHVR